MGRFQGAGAVFYLRHTFSFLSPTEGRSLITQQLLAKTWKSQHLVLYFLAKVGIGSEVSIVDSGVDCSSRPRPRDAVPLCTMYSIQYSILYTIQPLYTIQCVAPLARFVLSADEMLEHARAAWCLCPCAWPNVENPTRPRTCQSAEATDGKQLFGDGLHQT